MSSVSQFHQAMPGHVEIACPACGEGRIAFMPQALAAGAACTCSTCGAGLSLGAEAQRLYALSLRQLEDLRQQSMK
jgi:predicted RNA-binding Zn-ribbon protein involved in translation (DUF1610 family)